MVPLPPVRSGKVGGGPFLPASELSIRGGEAPALTLDDEVEHDDHPNPHRDGENERGQSRSFFLFQFRHRSQGGCEIENGGIA